MGVVRGLRLPVLMATLVLLAGCGVWARDQQSLVERARLHGRLTIGIRFDQPGVGNRRPDGKFEGFDVDVARYIAHDLGVDDQNIVWKEAPPAERENLLESGQIDFAVAAYTITDQRKQRVDFAGPYLTVGQDLLVRGSDNSITGPQNLNGKRLCSVTGSTSAQLVRDKFAKRTQLVQNNRYSDCVTAMFAGTVDAVTTDDVILAGYAAQDPELLKVVGRPFTQQQYGVGVKKGDTGGINRINLVLRKMIGSGAWQEALQRNIGPSGYRLPQPPVVDQ
jgi:glutamate transport system substrate-binding protein